MYPHFLSLHVTNALCVVELHEPQKERQYRRSNSNNAMFVGVLTSQTMLTQTINPIMFFNITLSVYDVMIMSTGTFI